MDLVGKVGLKDQIYSLRLINKFRLRRSKYPKSQFKKLLLIHNKCCSI